MAQELADLLLQNADITNIGDASGLVGSTTPGTWFVDLLATWPGQAGTVGATKLSYTGYSQATIARSSSGWTRSGQTTTQDNDLTFGKKTDAGTQTAQFWGMARLTSPSTFDFIGPLALEESQPFVVDDTIVDTFIVPGHTYSDGDQVQILDVVGATLPSGTADGDIVYVRDSATDRFKIEATVGGGAIDVGNGAGRIAKVLTKTIAQNDTPQIDAGDMQITFD